MKTVKKRFTIGTATIYPRDYYHAPMALYDNGDQVAIIAAGTGDDIELFTDSGFIYIYTGRDALGYMGLEVYDMAAGHIIDDVFIDHDADFELYAHYTPMNRTKQMLNHVN